MHRIRTVILIEEIETDGHSPAKFVCDDGHVYYVKYRSGNSFNKDEINCLVFEMVCTRLLQALNLPTPELAIVEVDGNSITPGQVKINKRYLKGGISGLGSQEIIQADILREIEIISNKYEFNKLLNPDDLIRFGMFDLWVDNSDRHTENYNLLTRWWFGKMEFIAIDHAFAFGGIKGMSTFNPSIMPSGYKKLVSSRYFKSVVRFYEGGEEIQMAHDFVSSLGALPVAQLVHEVFTTIPEAWQINPALEQRIIDFLVSPKRVDALRHISF